jgi:hypothetical protein
MDVPVLLNFFPEVPVNVLYLFLLTFLEATGTSLQIYEMKHTDENLPSQAYKRLKLGRRTGKTVI